MAALNKLNGIPLYTQILQSPRGDIVNIILSPGQKILSKDEPAARFGVGRMAASQGISNLIDKGLPYRRHGVGAFITQPGLMRDHP